MMIWKIDVFEDGKSAATFDMPADKITPAEVRELLCRLAAKSLTHSEIAGCTWREGFGKLGLLDVQEQDEGRTLACGDGLVHATARQQWKP